MSEKETQGKDDKMEVDDKEKTEEKKEETTAGGDDDEEETPLEEQPPRKDIEEKANVIFAETQSSGNLLEGLEKLLYIEKKQRQADEEWNTIFVCKKIMELCYHFKNWKLLVEQITVLTKRRSQFRRCVMHMVKLGMSWLETETIKKDENTLLEIITCLRTVTDGKIFVEVERARLTRILSHLQEDKGDLEAASKTLQELQIETFGSMRKREKCEFLLQQVRLCLATSDFIRAGIIRNKITPGVIKGLRDLEIEYWQLSLIYYFNSSDRNMLELAKSYQKLKDLYSNSNDSNEQKKEIKALIHCVYALILAKFNNEQNDLLHRIFNNQKRLLGDHCLIENECLRLLTTYELIGWPLNPEIQKTLESFRFEGVMIDNRNSRNYLQSNESMIDLFKERIIQHNIRVVAKYYTQISMQRLTNFLGIDQKLSEKYVSEMVTSKTIYARIDRISGIISFREKESGHKILNDWRLNIEKLLELVDKTCHEIHKDVVIHSNKNKK